MSKDFNWKPYIIVIIVISCLSCLINWRIGFGICLGSLYFFLNDKLNQKKFPNLDGKGKAISKVFLIIFLQFIMIVAVALFSYYVGKLYSFFGTFAGMTVPHFYFIIKELVKSKK